MIRQNNNGDPIMQFTKSPTILFYLFLLLCFTASQVNAATVLQKFKGSIEKGVYQSDFVEFYYAKSGEKKPEIKTVEGRIHSRILLKPKNKSNLELFRSYQQALKNSGFTFLHQATPSKQNPKWLINQMYNSNGMGERPYQGTEDRVYSGDRDYLRMFGAYYLSAAKQTGNIKLYVAVVLSSQRNLYLIDELTIADMEHDTVKLDLNAMKDEIANTGKIAVYDIYFETGSAKLINKSNHALSVVAQFLKQDNYNYYVVGHTDDTGNLEHNLKLSMQRSEAIITALTTQHRVNSKRLHANGVGPLAPASNNISENGKKMNRRVEIVRRLKK